MELVEQRNMKVATACRLFGHCRQAFYQSKADIEAEVNRDKFILDNVREILDEDPGMAINFGSCWQNFMVENSSSTSDNSFSITLQIASLT